MNENKLFQLKIMLYGIEPPVWRRFIVKSNITFHSLHDVIQEAMGWEDYHMFEFEFNDAIIEADQQGGIDSMFIGFRPRSKKRNLKASKTRLHDVISMESQEFEYVYDFGDNWQHLVVVEKILDNDPFQKFPVCVGGARACPPEDCGSVPGYYELMKLRKNKKHPEYEERIVEWIGEDYNPDFFDIKEANMRLGVNTVNEKYLVQPEKELLEKIVDLASNAKYNEALVIVNIVLNNNPKSYPALFLRYRINKKSGKTDEDDLELAYKEAKKQGAGKKVLAMMEEEIDDVEFVKIHKKFKKLIKTTKQSDIKNPEKKHIINRSNKDYGVPDLTQEFFEDNPIDMFSAACIGYNLLLNPELEKKTIKKLYKLLPKSRKGEIDNEKKEIIAANGPEEMLKIIMKGIDTINEYFLMDKILEFEERVVPDLIDILKGNTNDGVVEYCIKLIYNCKMDHTKQILDALSSIKIAYNLSMVCLLLGLTGNRDVIKPLWDCYHFLKEEYPSESYAQGPLLALSEIENKLK
ncbi:MAG: plasmid pRiA4b ORF-3 family protein [Nanoarchaeota archaeon]|nr:plasmid pRiA4b ORF-3 family protein [Nanoarchaeota archaeon]